MNWFNKCIISMQIILIKKRKGKKEKKSAYNFSGNVHYKKTLKINERILT